MSQRASLFHNRLTQGFGVWADVWVRSGWRLQVHCATGHARVLDPARRAVLSGEEAACLALIGRLAPSAGCRRAVVLLHGILNHPGIMDRLATALGAAGWAVANLAYPSTRLSIDEHATAVRRAARALAEDGAAEIGFVGHSLGGLVARAAMAGAGQDGWQPGRLVMIGSPVAGSAMARTLRLLPGYETLLGPSGISLATPAAGATAGSNVAIIAGGTGGRGFNPLLPGDNDLTVTVAETRLPGAQNLLVHAVHNALPQHPDVLGACAGFLSGRSLKP